MSGLKSIDLAIDVAIRKRDLAGKNLVEVQRSLQFEQGQLDQLESYAADSQARWSASAQVSMTPELLRHHYQFMERLRQAIDLQQTTIGDIERQVKETRKLLLSAEMRLSSLHKLRARKLSEHNAVLARRDQKQTDEFAAMQFTRAASRLH